MSTSNEQSYLDALRLVKDYGIESRDRTGVGTIRYSGVQLKYHLGRGYPLLTTKKVLFYPMIVELLWFMQGKNDLKWLQDRGCNIWNHWHNDDMTIGPGYGVQWRRAYNGPIHTIDQLGEVIKEIKSNPESRRLIVNSWSVPQIDQMALPPCHFCYQFLVNNGQLDCIVYQRSGDMFLGVPFNMASYGALTTLIAIECDLMPGEITHNIGDAHIYSNHLEQVETQLSRIPFEPPVLTIDDKVFPEDWDDCKRGLMYWIDHTVTNLQLMTLKVCLK